MMLDYRELLTHIREFKFNGVLSDQGEIKLHLFLKDKNEDLVLTLLNIFYLFNSFYNFINLACLNNSGIFYNNKDKNLYHVKTC